MLTGEVATHHERKPLLLFANHIALALERAQLREEARLAEVAARVAPDHAYIDAVRRGEEPVDARLGPDATYDWLSDIYQSNLEQARGR